MTCKATTPLVSRHSSSFIRPAYTDVIVDEAAFTNIQQNPVRRIVPSLSESDATQLNSRITKNLNNIISELPDSVLEQYPTLWNRVYQGSLNIYEVADFMYVAGYDPIEVDREITITPISTDTNNLIEQLDFYFDNNLANSVSGGFCSAFGNVFKKLGALIAIGKGLAALFGLGLPGIIDLIRKKIESLIDKLKDKFLKLVEQVKAKATAMLNQIKGSIDKIAKNIQQAAEKVKEFFSDLSIQKVKDLVKGLISKLVQAFEKMTPEVLALLAFRFCQLTEGIQGFFQAPVQELQNTVTRFESAHRNLTRMGQINQFTAATFGARRLSADIVAEQRRIMRTALNAASARPLNTPSGSNSGGSVPASSLGPTTYVAPPFEASEYEMLNSITENGNQYFTFAANVKNMHSRVRSNVAQYLDRYAAGDTSFDVRQHVEDYNENHHRDGAGWKMVLEYNPSLYIMLARVSEKMSEQFGGTFRFTINSAYRSLYYNFWLNYGENDSRSFQQIMASASSTRAVRTSPHQSAAALDVATPWNNQQKAFFIAECSRQGFKRIGIYNTFIHIDIKDGAKTWGRTPSWAREAMNGHLNGTFVNGNNPVPPVNDPYAERTQPVETPNPDPNTGDDTVSDADYRALYGPNADKQADAQLILDVYNGEYSDGEIVTFEGSPHRVVQVSEETADFEAGYELVPIQGTNV